MNAKALPATGFALLLAVNSAAFAQKPRGVVHCAELQWSAQVLALNPDIALACQGVYEKDGVLYARATIEVVNVVGNKLRFRTLLTNGSKGKRRSITVGNDWRVTLDGQEYRASDLLPGQQLNIYLPEDRFVLSVLDSNETQSVEIEPVGD